MTLTTMTNPPEPAARFRFEGDLAATPLPEVLETIHRYKVPGVLECNRDGWTRKLFILNGDVIFATSNNLSDSLGDFLLRKGRISKEQYDESVVRLKAEKKRQGVVLVEMGVISPKDLFSSVLEQVQEIVWDTFNWDHGSVAFTVGRYKDDELVKLNLPTRNVVIRGIQGVTDAKRLVSRMGSSWTVWEPTYEVPELTDLRLDDAEMKLLTLVDGKRTLVELTKEGPFPQAVNAKILYAFSVLRLIRRRENSGIKVQWKTTGGAMSAD
jgi:hypothetical protein